MSSTQQTSNGASPQQANVAAEAASRDSNAQPGPKRDRRARADRGQYSQIVRTNLASEGAAAKMLSRRSQWAGKRPDMEYYKESEAALLAKLRSLAPQYRTRPSLASPLLGAAGSALGVLSALLPARFSNAVTGGVAEALTEQYNDQLRDLRAAGLADSDAAAPLRSVLRALRDHPRATDGSVKVPDLAALQRPRDLTLEEGLAGAVKFGFKGLLGITAHV